MLFFSFYFSILFVCIVPRMKYKYHSFKAIFNNIKKKTHKTKFPKFGVFFL